MVLIGDTIDIDVSPGRRVEVQSCVVVAVAYPQDPQEYYMIRMVVRRPDGVLINCHKFEHDISVRTNRGNI